MYPMAPRCQATARDFSVWTDCLGGRLHHASVFLLPDSRRRRMCCVIAGVSLARRPVAAAIDVFCFFLGAGWCFVDGEVLAMRVFGRLAVESERVQYRLAGARREKCQKSRSDPNTEMIPHNERRMG